MSRATEDAMDELHRLTCEQLTAKIRSGEATAGDYSAAIKLLKDNGITTLSSAPRMGGLADAAAKFPFADDEESSSSDPDVVRH